MHDCRVCVIRMSNVVLDVSECVHVYVCCNFFVGSKTLLLFLFLQLPFHCDTCNCVYYCSQQCQQLAWNKVSDHLSSSLFSLSRSRFSPLPPSLTTLTVARLRMSLLSNALWARFEIPFAPKWEEEATLVLSCEISDKNFPAANVSIHSKLGLLVLAHCCLSFFFFLASTSLTRIYFFCYQNWKASNIPTTLPDAEWQQQQRPQQQHQQ